MDHNEGRKTRTEQVADHFSQHWRQYDAQIRTAIPFYDIMLDTIVTLLKETVVAPRQRSRSSQQ